MSVSRRAGLLTGLGFSLASATWALLAIGGVNVLISHAPAVHTVVRVAGGAYLLWLGLKMIATARRPIGNGAAAVHPSGASAFGKAFVVSMTNPKSISFYGSIFSVMVPLDAPLWFDAAIVLLALFISALWYCGLALLFSHRLAGSVYGRLKAFVETAMGVFLIAMGGRVLLGR
ncbi:LysE family transporter [Herbaspirillum sp. WKF16]|uniref:LysE family transporter n=1 Tax=Herbaspirillum sp. WKF16 TaxID=3028312 RepID=UPI0023A985FE|nr:LysE family transporter [Herbaspirillum sp. WKF16]WDZ98354.1 LysE family transporter [Herbaspirillum sp. WKF16]